MSEGAAAPIAKMMIQAGGSARGPLPFYEGDFVLEGNLALDCGATLLQPKLHYAVYGRLNAARDNTVLVCHALSGSALVGAWWPGLFETDGGERALIDLRRDCVICVNLLGSCYGSTGPGSINPALGKPYAAGFPLVSIRDNVRAQARLLDSLGVNKLRLILGGSIGGMQAIDWAIQFPERVERAVVIAVAPLDAMGLGLNHLQRLAIENDPAWLQGNYLPQSPPRKGLALARQIATLSYKSPQLFSERFARRPNRNGEDPWAPAPIGGRFDVAGYLDHQGEIFPGRFDANSYLAITRTMDTWDPTRGTSSPEEAYRGIRAKLMFVGISSDWLFPPQAVETLARAVKAAGVQADYREMQTAHGHDAFLAEQTELARLLQ